MSVSLIVIGLDLIVLNVVLSMLVIDLKVFMSQLQWFANAYMLVFVLLLFLVGLLGDRFGSKRLMFGVLVLFGLVLAACAFVQMLG